MRLSLWLLLAALASSGCMVNRYSSDPNVRLEQLQSELEGAKQIREERERFWIADQPSRLTPQRASGPVGPGPEPAKFTLTVANVLKEDAMLFSVSPKGELTFVRKVPHGEAADLDVTPGQRYAAVFSAAPHQIGFEVQGKAGTWLLRNTNTEGATSAR